MTEVDAEFKGNRGAKESQRDTGEVISTRGSEQNTSMPQNKSSMLDIEKAEFKMVIKDLISKE